MPILYVVATPIGNLGDISQRALDILGQVDVILAEDTRTTKNLLAHFGIQKPIISYHQHSKVSKINEILAMLQDGKNLALVSDAGTPGISDPGNKLVDEINKFIALSEAKGGYIDISPIPGPSAITALASVCGFSMDKFLFLGFPPAKNKRKKFFEEVVSSKYPVIFYESPYRILKTLNELLAMSSSRNIKISCVAGRELTKKFETIYRGSIDEVIEKIKNDPVKGEFVVAISSQ